MSVPRGERLVESAPTLLRHPIVKLQRLALERLIDKHGDRVRKELSDQPAGLVPEIPSSDFLDMETLRQLADHGLNESSGGQQRLEPPFRTVIVHVGPKDGLQVNAALQEVVFEQLADVAFIPDEQAGYAGNQLPQGFSLIGIGGGQGKSRANAAGTDEQIAMKSVVELVLGGTVSVGRLAPEDPGAVGPLESAHRNREPIDEVYRIGFSAHLEDHALLQTGPQRRTA